LQKWTPKHHEAGLVGPACLRGTGPVNLVSTAGPECQIVKLSHRETEVSVQGKNLIPVLRRRVTVPRR